MARNDQLDRFLKITALLTNRQTGLSVEAIREKLQDVYRLKVSKETIYRDIKVLMNSGMDVVEEIRENEKGLDTKVYKIAGKKRNELSLELTQQEVVTLFLLKGLSTSITESVLTEHINNIFIKIDDLLTPQLKDYLHDLNNVYSFNDHLVSTIEVDDDVLNTIESAIEERCLLQFSYDSSNSGTTTTRKVAPHFISFMDNGVYLVAEDLKDKKLKHFALSRAKDLNMLNTEIFKGERVKPEDYYKNGIGLMQTGIKQHVTFTCDRTIGKYLEDRKIHPSQKQEWRGEELFVSLDVLVNDELVRKLLSYGNHIKVTGPDFLSEKLLSTVVDIIKLYSEKKAA